MNSVVLLHGALGCAADMAPLASELQKIGFESHCLEFTGHGQTPAERAFGIDSLCEQLEDFINTRHSEPVPVFGYSMGGYVAMCCALRKKARLAGIITLGTKFKWNNAILAKETALLDAGLMAQKVPAFAAALEKKHGAKLPALLEGTRVLLTEITARQLLAAEPLSEINNRVLLGVGDNDAMVSPDETLETRKSLKAAQLCVLPGTKHPFDQVNHALLAAIISGFVTAH